MLVCGLLVANASYFLLTLSFCDCRKLSCSHPTLAIGCFISFCSTVGVCLYETCRNYSIIESNHQKKGSLHVAIVYCDCPCSLGLGTKSCVIVHPCNCSLNT